MANQLRQIKHIVQLMLENRSFDQMLGFLYENTGTGFARNISPKTGQPFAGLTGNETNPDDTGKLVNVYKIDPKSDTYRMPGADPGEGYQNTNYQLFSTDVPQLGEKADMQGFVVSFKAAIASDLAKHYKDSLPGTQSAEIMGMYDPDSLPIMSALARGFAVCDYWFSSVPTMTMPNRAFACAATSQGHLDDKVKVFTCPSIFGRLTQGGKSWAIYGYNRDPMTRLDFTDTQHADESCFGHFRDFKDRAAAGKLPEYTFLEPSWSSDGNSQHPNYDVALGEQLIHDVYYALRGNTQAWNDTLLIITYDEHGGNYDHIPPPWGAAPPDSTIGEFDFDFTRFGVRVPAILVSPRIAEGTVFRVQEGTIDHTSVLKTIEVLWNLKPLTARDAAAPDLGDVLTLSAPRQDDPLSGIVIPDPSGAHPNSSQPSRIDILQASKVAALPLRNEKGAYGSHTPPDLSSSDSISDYIQNRMAAWTQHIQRIRQKHPRFGRMEPKLEGMAPKKAGSSRARKRIRKRQR